MGSFYKCEAARRRCWLVVTPTSNAPAVNQT
jgi:hypothetical protein